MRCLLFCALIIFLSVVSCNVIQLGQWTSAAVNASAYVPYTFNATSRSARVRWQATAPVTAVVASLGTVGASPWTAAIALLSEYSSGPNGHIIVHQCSACDWDLDPSEPMELRVYNKFSTVANASFQIRVDVIDSVLAPQEVASGSLRAGAILNCSADVYYADVPLSDSGEDLTFWIQVSYYGTSYLATQYLTVTDGACSTSISRSPGTTYPTTRSYAVSKIIEKATVNGSSVVPGTRYYATVAHHITTRNETYVIGYCRGTGCNVTFSAAPTTASIGTTLSVATTYSTVATVTTSSGTTTETVAAITTSTSGSTENGSSGGQPAASEADYAIAPEMWLAGLGIALLLSFR
jgi:hypothetical protein